MSNLGTNKISNEAKKTTTTKAKKGDTVITYSDKNLELKDEESAYVFKPTNEKNSFTQIDLEEVINLK